MIGRFARRPLPPLGAALDFGSNVAQGRGLGESVGRTALSGGGAGLGAVGAGALCGALTFGLAAAACGAGGAILGGWVGDKAGNAVFGDD